MDRGCCTTSCGIYICSLHEANAGYDCSQVSFNIIVAVISVDLTPCHCIRICVRVCCRYAWGYFGSVLCLFICVGITVVNSDDSIKAYGINCLVAGLWWLGFSTFTFAWVKPRPGPPLPAGEHYLILPWKRMAVTMSRVKQLPQTFMFLVCWFIFSDGFNVISSVGAIYANTR